MVFLPSVVKANLVKARPFPNNRRRKMVYTQEEAEMMHKALKEIAKGEGRFSLDHLKHAKNTIEDMKELANQALAQVE
jgi:DNA-binding MarR family transcriptional regulator